MQEQTKPCRLRAVRGGRHSRKATARQLMRTIVDGAPPEGLGREDLDLWAHQLGHPLTLYEAILVTQAAQALEGDLRAAQFVRDTLGDKPGGETEEAGPAISPGERALIRKVAARLGVADPVEP